MSAEVCATAITHSFASSSVLAEGNWVKVCVAESGLYRISYDEIRNLGLDPATIRVYGYGGAMLSQDFNLSMIDDLPIVPTYIDKGADGHFSSGDYIYFYGQGPISWSYNGTRFLHTRNTYSDFGYYFLTSSKGASVEPDLASAPSGTASDTISTYINLQVHELDTVNLIDRSGIEGGGREWYGELFTPGTSRTFSFDVPEAICLNRTMQLYSELAAYSTGGSSTFTLQSRDTTASVRIDEVSVSDNYTMAKAGTIDIRFRPSQSGKQDFTLRYANSAPTAVGALNYIELSTECNLTIVPGKPLFFCTNKGYNSNQLLLYRISGASTETQVWDITDRQNITRLSTQYANGVLTFKAVNRSVRHYVAFTPGCATSALYMSESAISEAKQPKNKRILPTTTMPVGTIANQNLHALSDIDLVIITPQDLITEAHRLGAAHQQYDGLTVAVVTDEQVYNEFSSGTPDATAYRRLLKMLYDRAKASGGSVHTPGYLLLFGDGSFDNRKILIQSGNNRLLTYQAKNSLNEVKAYATDDYFGFMDNSEGENDSYATMEVSVGRLPVNTLSEAQGVVDKLIRHMRNSNKGPWKQQLLFVADDGDGNLHTKCSDAAAEELRVKNPSFVVNKVYLDAYTQEVNASGESYPLAESRMNELLREGVLLFDYCGHSGYNNASSEGLISVAGIRKMRNENAALWMFASCSFALFDAGKTSAAEEAVLHPNGGAIAVCSSDRTVYAEQNKILNNRICNALMAHQNSFSYPNRIGDAIRIGKNNTGRDENKMAYVLIGDPAISLHYPTQYEVVTTSIPDTLHALSINHAEGFLRSPEGDTATWFNGRLHISIYDKLQQITTLDNDQSDEGSKQKYTYNDYPNVLFKGSVDIVDGRFGFDFMVPKDVRYNYGNGRIVYYAYDTTTEEEAVGHHESFIIGGSSPVEVVDTIGPDLKLYINTPEFANGDQTNETPHLYAELSDEHGINTVGSGIGHDLLLIVDGKPSETYVLNEYFSAAQNSYTQGIVSYQMNELSEGTHTAFFRAWDLLNNSSSETITFQVVKGLQPEVVSVMSYPNPISSDGVLSIAVDYTQPDVIMQTDVFVYDLSGRLIFSLSQRGTDNIKWDLGATNTPSGVYLYKVQLSSESTKTISKTGKLIITK